MVITPTFGQIKAQVGTIRKKTADANIIGIHSPGRWTGEKELQDGETRYFIDQCDSPLEIRLALRRVRPRGAIQIILTELDEMDLSDDIRIRLARRKLHHMDSWQVIRTLFQAHAVDTRVTQQAWMAEQLLKFAAVDDCPAAPGGFLDLETAWAYLLERGLGIGVARPDLPLILKWSLNETNVATFRGADPQFREAAIVWLAQFTEPATEVVLRSIQRSKQLDALAIGLAAHVVFHAQAEGKLDKAVGRIEERYLGGQSSDRNQMRRWGIAAREVVRLQLADTTPQDPVLKQADGILKDVQADTFAYLSDVSLIGFDQRLEQLGIALKDAIHHGISQDLDFRYKDFIRHHLARIDSRRIERVEMAMRLLRWLQTIKGVISSPNSFAEAVDNYLTGGSFVDTARLALRHGDVIAALSEAFMALSKKSAVFQEKQSKIFADLLRDWTNAGSKSSDILPVEEVLTSIVGPLSESSPVLLIVMDGMSVAVFNQLIDEVVGRHWAFIRQANRTMTHAAIATIPSVTEYSRTSLLCGRLVAGTSALEKTEFPKHPALAATAKAGKPPLLFHKSALNDQEDGGLSPEIRAKVASADHRVVGVVINAIDDYLLKGEQIDVRWKLDDIKALPTLLHEANHANRAVVITSDHGHILELSTDFRAGDGGDRWREAKDSPSDSELIFEGERVLTDSGRVIVPWTETVRYASKKGGYHGGITPQEIVAPIAVLFPGNPTIEGWVETNWTKPDWWSATSIPTEETAVKAEPVKSANGFPDSLLDWREDPVVEIQTHAGPATLDWIRTLISSPVYAEQKLLAGRSYPKSEQALIDVLSALDHGGYTMTPAALSSNIDYPPLRLRGLLAVMQKVLNLDGYEVLSRDTESDAIVLDIELLRKQFELS